MEECSRGNPVCLWGALAGKAKGFPGKESGSGRNLGGRSKKEGGPLVYSEVTGFLGDAPRFAWKGTLEANKHRPRRAGGSARPSIIFGNSHKHGFSTVDQREGALGTGGN